MKNTEVGQRVLDLLHSLLIRSKMLYKFFISQGDGLVEIPF